MPLLIQAETTSDLQREVVNYLNSEADRYSRTAETMRKLTDKRMENARANALRLAAMSLQTAVVLSPDVHDALFGTSSKQPEPA